jgi:alpha/beta superfamily hydrolase
MAIRTTIRGLRGMFRASRAAPSWGRCLAAGAAILLLSSAAFADYAAGLTAFNRKDFAHAFSEWIESAKAGDAHAQHGLGMLYEMGQGVPYADPKAASEWYQKAATQNYAPAINNLARLYADGRGLKQDVPKAIELWSKAAEAGNTTARFNLGLQYAAGVGVKKDMKKAAEYLLQAAESGLPEAQFAVAGYYRDGTGVPKDMAAARQWYDRAAAAGFEPARKELAAIDKPAVSPTPAIEEAAPADSQKTETPPAEAAKTTEKPLAETHEATPGETEQAATPPAEEKQEPTPPAQPPVEASTTGHAPEEQAAGEQEQAAEEQPTQEGQEGEQAESAPETPAEGAPGADDLPVADSVTGDARVYRIWVYESGQEGDARSYWNKLTMQYPGLLKKLDLDLRRYFLGEAKGSLYRVFAGPFESLGDAQKACEDIRTRFGDQFCRPVLN